MQFRCPECRTRRSDHGLFTQHLRNSGHRLCRCGGYHYSHRPGSPYCERNALSLYRVASRAGECNEVLQEILEDLIDNTPGVQCAPGEPPPF